MNTATAEVSLSARPTTTGEPPRRRRRPRRGLGIGMLWILPALALVIGMIYFSIGFTGYVSTLEWNGFVLSPSEFVGWDNYTQMVQDPVFWTAIWHTVVFFIVTFTIQTAIGFTFAALLHSKIRLAPIYKVIIFVPTVLAPATMAPVFRSIFDANGQFNWVLEHVGLGDLARPWLADGATAMPVVMAVTIWQWTGLTFILFYAAMSQIDPQVLEAARVDGASNLRTLRSIIWPLCAGTTIALATLGVIGALKTFDVPYLVTKAGPNHATEFLGTYIYQTMVQEKHFGYAAAISVALLVIAIGGGVLLRARRGQKES
ncbi:sugar ABC transporter permease [Herbiconiux sp. CPCC 205763]|uniref:Sugar ABC transporter permease n=1 Tax=Herbiconiux aconitum TaxID=2970913 RepID=A0ABT2GMP8_9MICO|nr:sugar ABC transporter permease [Herbiconiux aconitum]MCS5717506.1 sugar ABC transporter permease [Herbiconiux aconitum]